MDYFQEALVNSTSVKKRVFMCFSFIKDTSQKVNDFFFFFWFFLAFLVFLVFFVMGGGGGGGGGGEGELKCYINTYIHTYIHLITK